jgi:hypothetical protein
VEDKEGDESDLVSMPSFAKVFATCKTFKLFFYPYSISMHDDQNILDLELTWFHLKHKTMS